VPQQRQRLLGASGDGGVRDAEPRDLDPAAEPELDDVGLDAPVVGGDGVLRELTAGRRELPQVAADGVHERAHRLRRGSAAGAAEFAGDEVELLVVPGDRRAHGLRGPGLARLVEQPLRALPAGVPEHDTDLRGGRRDVGGGVGDERVVGRGDPVDDDDGSPTEQGRAGEQREPPRLVPGGVDLLDRDARIGLAGGRQHRGHGPFREQVLRPDDEDHGLRTKIVRCEGTRWRRTACGTCGAAGHGLTLPCRPDTAPARGRAVTVAR
jgi:hypothetical protein